MPELRKTRAVPEEEKKVTPDGEVVKTEPKEDIDAPSQKKGRHREAGVQEKEEETGLTPQKKKEKEEEAEDDADEQGNDEDAMAPEAEPTQPRNEVPDGVTKFREDAVHVYGLDFLKTGHMEEIFGQFSHKYIEWINDSSANVIFRNAASARKALESLSYPKAGDDPWRRTPDILVQDDLPAVFLQMRLAVSADTKERKRSVPSMTPPAYVEESNRRNHNFTMASLYDKKDRVAEKTEKGKRPAQVLPAAEVDKRRRRAERFAETLGEVPVASETAASDTPKVVDKADDTSKAADDEAKSTDTAEEEAAKRKQRAERFATKTAEATDAKAADASASTAGVATAGGESAEGETAPNSAAPPEESS